MRAMHRRLRSLTAVLALAAAVVVLAPSAPASAWDPDDGLRIESETTITVDMAGEVIHVDELIRLTNESPDEVVGDYVRTYYFSELAWLVLPGATNVSASWEGGAALPVSVAPTASPLASVATIDLVPDLYYGPAKEVRLRYDVPTQPPRSGAAAQINRAFATLPVFTGADPGLGSVTVVLPGGLDIEVTGSTMVRHDGAGVVSYTANGIADPQSWLATVIVRDDSHLVSQTVFFEDIGVRLQAWPNDGEWLAFTGDLVERGLPALRDAIGRHWNLHGQLDVVETSAPYAYGYAGWYAHDESLIEIGDELDAHVTLHEMAHAWFNGEAFDSRWINEGLADEFAAVAMVDLGMDRPYPEEPNPFVPEAVDLNEWHSPLLTGDDVDDSEAYGYEASWHVVHAITEEIGVEAMSDVVVAAMDHHSPYPAETDTAGLDRVADWRTFLDLLEGVGGSQQATNLFYVYAATYDQLDLLDARTLAREEYAALLDAGDGWAPPAAVRTAMTDWDFAAATQMLPRVRAAFADRDAIAAVLAEVDLAVPAALQEDVEQATDLASAERALDAAAGAADALAEAVRAESGANVFARLGMLVIPVADDLAAARDAFEEGDWSQAEERADAAADGVGTATAAGAGTVGILVVGMTALVLVLWLRARRTAARTAAPAPAVAAPAPYAPAGPAPAALAPPAAPAAPTSAPPPPPPPGSGAVGQP